MQRTVLAIAFCALLTPVAEAADANGDSSGEANWVFRLGGALDAYHVNQVDNDEGTDSDGRNTGAHLDLAAGGLIGEGWGTQFDVRGSLFSDSHGADDDWTKSYLTGGMHLYALTPNGLLGAFAGAGISDDTGDTDENQTYWFGGVEGQWAMSSAVLFAEAGYLDGTDEFDEGINQAVFGRVGVHYFARPDLVLTGAVSGAAGLQDNGDEPDSDALIGDLHLEAEHGFGNGQNSVFVSYDGTLVSFDGGDHRTDFHGVMLGFRMRLGGSGDLQSTYSGPGALSLTPVDRWFAYTANEVE